MKRIIAISMVMVTCCSYASKPTTYQTYCPPGGLVKDLIHTSSSTAVVQSKDYSGIPPMLNFMGDFAPKDAISMYLGKSHIIGRTAYCDYSYTSRDGKIGKFNLFLTPSEYYINPSIGCNNDDSCIQLDQ